MSSLVDYLAQFRDGHNFTPPQRERIQDLIFYIPADKQQKYKQALTHLVETAKVKICGCPVKPKMALSYFGVGAYAYPGNSGKVVMLEVGSYHHNCSLTWQSSTGDMSSLREVGTREHVRFRTSPAAEPFNYVQASVPMEFFHGASPDGGHFGNCTDDHSTKHPSVICCSPRKPGQLVAEQWYQFTVDRGLTWKNIPNAAFLITKGVRMSGGRLVFFFKKENWAEHNSARFCLEVEYEIGPPPTDMPPANTKLDMQSGNRADIRRYASKVISQA
ncbi:hypothetical protein [Paludibaculum fermentans]|uniref:hypothetical protein n=1 Tax=Paludibaculum fermentans TaxID=1473598 RepID=UPI003EBB1427